VRQRWLSVPILTGALLAGHVPVSNASSTTQTVRLDGLTDAPIVLRGGAPREARLAFDLPPNTAQGPTMWWKLRLRYRLRFAPGSGPGYAWVSSDTNGRTAASIEYSLRGRGDKLRIRRTTVDADSQKERHVLRRRDTVSFENYLQYAGVRGGANTWTLRLEQSGQARVARLEILGASAIVSTGRSPYALNLDTKLLDDPPVAERPFRILVRARDRSSAILTDAAIQAQPRAGVRLLGATARDGGREFTFQAPAAGRVAVGAIASRKGKRNSTTLQFEVTSAVNDGPSALTWVIVLTPGLFGGLFWWLRSHRRPAT